MAPCRLDAGFHCLDCIAAHATTALAERQVVYNSALEAVMFSGQIGSKVNCDIFEDQGRWKK
jgi:hypothetical protein